MIVEINILYNIYLLNKIIVTKVILTINKIQTYKIWIPI